MIPNKSEQYIVSQFFRYNHLLDGNSIPYNKKGATIACHKLQHNSTLSELLGYKILKSDVNFIHKNLNFFKYEVIKPPSICYQCKTKLIITNSNTTAFCPNCSRKNDYYDVGFYYFISSISGGILKEEKLNKMDECTFYNEFFDIDAKFLYDDYYYKTNYGLEYIKRILRSKTIKVDLKSFVYRPGIVINSMFINEINEIVHSEKIKNSHLSILGWKKLKLSNIRY